MTSVCSERETCTKKLGLSFGLYWAELSFLINFLSLPSKPFCVKVWDSQKGALSFDS